MGNKKTLPICHDPMCAGNATACFASFRHRGRVHCSCLNDTNFSDRNNWCPFFKTTEEVLKEDPKFFERIDRPWLKLKD